MVYSVFAVRDNKVGFLAPFCEATRESAKRTFSRALTSDSLMGFSPSDFELYCLGTYDTVSGTLSPTLPDFVCRGSDFGDVHA